MSDMSYVQLGRTGVRVSRLCFGTMSFGGDADESASSEMFHLCRERGINFFDCADVYQHGRAEEILGGLIRDCRNEVVIATKAYFPMGKDVNARGATRLHLFQAVESSLRRLETDRIDIFYIHRFDDITPLDETLRALDDLVRQGKILYPAVSNFSAWQTAKALEMARAKNRAPLAAVQPMYNLVKRQAETEILPHAFAEGLGVFPYSPLGGGLLTGKYRKTERPGSGRLIDNKMYATRYGAEWMYASAGRFTDFAAERDFDPAALAVAWVAAHPAVTAPIIGARNVGQLTSSLGSLEIGMTESLRREISALTPEPAPATDRNEESTAFNYGDR
jgi:aryl-alcohol dehydrogenase-like predicted oxidoreductase